MIGIIDRYMVRTFIRAFLICFSSLVSLYIVIDAFCNLDEFFERSHGLVSLLAVMAEYYSYRICYFFDRVSGIVTTLPVLFTLSWMQRNNELTPLSAAGVSAARVIAPLFCCALVVCGMAALNQEMIIPKIAEELQKGHGDDRRELVQTHARYDRSGFLLDGQVCFRNEQAIRPAFVTFPPQLAGFVVELRATEAKYVPPAAGDHSGGWLLSGLSTPPRGLESILEPLANANGTYFVHTSLTFDQMSRSGRWFEFLSTAELLEELRDPSNNCSDRLAVILHMRLIRPLSSLTLLLLGIPFVLASTERRLVQMMGLSLAIGIAFQSFSLACQRFGELDYVAPTLAAWLPILVFGTLAIVMLDGVIGFSLPPLRHWFARLTGVMTDSDVARMPRRLGTFSPAWSLSRQSSDSPVA